MMGTLIEAPMREDLICACVGMLLRIEVGGKSVDGERRGRYDVRANERNGGNVEGGGLRER